MKKTSLLPLLFLTVHFADNANAQKTEDFPLRMDVVSFQPITTGYVHSGQTFAVIGNSVVSFGSAEIPTTAIVNTAVIELNGQKTEYVLWNKKLHLILGTYKVRPTKDGLLVLCDHKGKKKPILFRIISARKLP